MRELIKNTSILAKRITTTTHTHTQRYTHRRGELDDVAEKVRGPLRFMLIHAIGKERREKLVRNTRYKLYDLILSNNKLLHISRG